MNNPSQLSPGNPGESVRQEQCAENFEHYLQRCEEKHLWTMLLGIQERLGTRAEETGDLEKVRALAHRLSNLLTTIRLKNELALFNQNPAGFGPSQCCGHDHPMRPDGGH